MLFFKLVLAEALVMWFFFYIVAPRHPIPEVTWFFIILMDTLATLIYWSIPYVLTKKVVKSVQDRSARRNAEELENALERVLKRHGKI